MKPKLILQKGAQNDDFGTPIEVLELVRQTCGPICMDLASSEQHNKVVRAEEFYTIEDPCPSHPPVFAPITVWCNPPGPVKNVRWFWSAWQSAVLRGNPGAFLIFQIDHWRSLTPPLRPMWVYIWPTRLQYIGADSRANFSSALVLTCRPVVEGVVVKWGGK